MSLFFTDLTIVTPCIPVSNRSNFPGYKLWLPGFEGALTYGSTSLLSSLHWYHVQPTDCSRAASSHCSPSPSPFSVARAVSLVCGHFETQFVNLQPSCCLCMAMCTMMKLKKQKQQSKNLSVEILKPQQYSLCNNSWTSLSLRWLSLLFMLSLLGQKLI